MNKKSKRSETRAVPQEAVVTRLLRAASLCMMGVSLAMANLLPATAAEPEEFGPQVTVTAARNPQATPSEMSYLVAANRKLRGASRYPSGRDASLDRPSGTTTVSADVARDGRVVARRVDRSSGSALLDNMARSLVGRTHFPPFASGDWGDAPTHRFSVSYQFIGDAMSAGAADRNANTSVQ